MAFCSPLDFIFIETLGKCGELSKCRILGMSVKECFVGVCGTVDAGNVCRNILVVMLLSWGVGGGMGINVTDCDGGWGSVGANMKIWQHLMRG